MPCRLTTFQVNTWTQQKESSNSLYKIRPWLEFSCNTKRAQPKKSYQPQSLPSYIPGGGISPELENDVPYRVSQRPVEIC